MAKSVAINLGDKPVDLYDAVSRKFLLRHAKGTVDFDIPADAARLLVLVPAGSRCVVKDGKLLANGTPVDYMYENK